MTEGGHVPKGVVASLLLLLMGASGGACRRAATAFDCQSVCARYRDCIDIKYDVGACQQRCRREAADNKSFERKADACDGCIKGHSCIGATFDCGGQCLGVVP